jgi:hypothetical protein
VEREEAEGREEGREKFLFLHLFILFFLFLFFFFFFSLHPAPSHIISTPIDVKLAAISLSCSDDIIPP